MREETLCNSGVPDRNKSSTLDPESPESLCCDIRKKEIWFSAEIRHVEILTIVLIESLVLTVS